MNVNAIYRHQADVEAEAMLSNPQEYPTDFTLADRTAERMNRIAKGLRYVLCEILPQSEPANHETLHLWLDNILTIVEISRLDAEAYHA